MVGGFSFERSKFNRATQAYRQVGSAFKPFVYTAAIDSGYTPATQLMDTPVSFPGGAGQPAYAPLNYDRKFEGPDHAAARARAVAQRARRPRDGSARPRRRSSPTRGGSASSRRFRRTWRSPWAPPKPRWSR